MIHVRTVCAHRRAASGVAARSLPQVTQTARVRWFVPDSQQQGRHINQDYYIQVRYPRAQKWVTVAMAPNRTAAAKAAPVAYQGLLNAHGDCPNQCRVVSAGQLVREDGHRGARRADVDIARRHPDPSDA